MGDLSQLSVRRVFCGIFARPGENTPVAGRLAVVRSSAVIPFESTARKTTQVIAQSRNRRKEPAQG